MKKEIEKIILTIENCEEVLDQERLIGSGTTKSGKRKQFTYNPWEDEYKIWVDGRVLDYGEGVEYGMDTEELLEVYNSL